LGVGRGDLEKLHDMPVEQLVAAIAPAKRVVGRSPFPLLDRYDFGPVVDGVDLPTQPCDPEAPALTADIPLLIGDTKDEATRFLVDDDAVWNRTLSEADLRNRLTAIAGSEVDRLLDLYQTRNPSANPAERLVAALTAGQFWVRSVLFAERKAAQAGAAPVYMYSLAWESPAFGGRLKTPHAIDLPFVFDTTDIAEGTAGGPGAGELAAVMSASWTAFARTGNPATSGLPEWPAYTAAARNVMVFDNNCRAISDPDPEARRIWSRVATGK
jgi:para-nitrobenzyl esterase